MNNYFIEVINHTLSGFYFISGFQYTAWTYYRTIEIEFFGKNPANGAFIFKTNKNGYEALTKTSGFINNETIYTYKQNSYVNTPISNKVFRLKYIMDYTSIAYDVDVKLLFTTDTLIEQPIRTSIEQATNQKATFEEPFDLFIDANNASLNFNLTNDSSKLTVIAYANYLKNSTISVPLSISPTNIIKPLTVTGTIAPITLTPTIDTDIAVPTFSWGDLDITAITVTGDYINGEVIPITIEFEESTYGTKKYITYPYTYEAP